MNTEYSPVRRFAANEDGRDFVVGDIHGCFDQLERALAKREFNPEHDRCFCVGDLVDRGPNSEAALDWLARPWFYSCLGNHDLMLLDVDLDDAEARAWFENSANGWWLTLNDERRTQFRTVFATLPIVIEIASRWGSVGLVHADIPRGLSWQRFLNKIDKYDADAFQSALWGRLRAKGWFSAKVEGIDRVVCGHSVMPGGRAKQCDNIWFIDTGAYQADQYPQQSDRLALMELSELFA